MRQHPIVMVSSKEAKAICSLVVMGMETHARATAFHRSGRNKLFK